ncbi:MAG TPA: hypothetical protein VE449_03220 [Thermoleophilaceae bacterium]|jgi:hypothetical protein|nr:hypothetical protein [Thermoleophilaceae bacterium]
MLDVRSRAGIAAVTTGAALLLALPVVAAGQAPDVSGVVGGVKEKVGNAPPAPPVSVPAPPVNLPAPAAPPAPAPRGQGSPPARGPAVQAPAASPQAPPAQARSKKPADPGGGRGERPGPAPSPSQNEPAAGEGGGSGDGGSKAGGDGGADDGGGGGGGDGGDGKTTNVSQDGGAPTDVEIADEAVEAPVDASPSTLPFTGFQLALMVALGLAAVGTGLALRRGARGTG